MRINVGIKKQIDKRPFSRYNPHMYPYIFGISSYTIMLVLGLTAAMLIFRFLSITYRMSDKAFMRLGYILLIAVAFGFVFAFLFQLMYNAIASRSVAFKNVGITFMGGLIGGIFTFFIIAVFAVKGEMKKEIWTVVCIAPPAITAAHAFGRVGCFLNGCCYGAQTDSRIGVLFPGDIHSRIPTQLIEAIFLALLCGVLFILILKFKRYSLTMPVYLFAYSVFRFILEFYRGDDARAVTGALSPSQWQSLFMFCCAVALTVYMFVYKRIPFNGNQRAKAKKLSGFFVQIADK